MGKEATNADRQIEILSERNMDLDWDTDKIKEVLLDIGYYRLGFYWNPFEVDDSHNFREGTKFSDVIALYYLDADLRKILSRYINRIEINFRTKVVYYASNINKKSPTWFIDSQVVSQKYVDDFPSFYDDDFKKNNQVIKKHHKKYINDKYAPAWKTLEFFTFGAILKLYKSLREEKTKNRISKIYNILNINKFENFMNTIVHVRNVCAHGGVLFDLKVPLGIAKIPDLNFNDNNRHSLDSAIKVISYILGHISNSRKEEFDEAIDSLLTNNAKNPVIKEFITNKMGYHFQNK